MGPRMIVRCLALVGVALAVMAQSSGGLFEQPPAAVITHRAAEDKGLDLMIDYQNLIESKAPPKAKAKAEADSDDPSPVPTESSSADKDPPPRVDWSRSLEEGWQMDPVLLNRRQAGQPSRPGDDETNQTFGIQLRKEF